MTSEMEIIQYLRERDQALLSSRSSGQEATLQLVSEARSLRGSQSSAFLQALVQLIERSDPNLSSFAIEYLIQEQSRAGVSYLERLVGSASQSEDWFQPALLGLLRVGHKPIQELAISYVARHWADQDFPLVLLTQLVSVAPEDGVRLGALFLSRRLPVATADGFESICQAFVNGYLRHDKDCLIHLVRSLKDLDDIRLEAFVLAVVEFLDKPWIVKRVGSASVEELKERICLATRVK